MADDWIMSVFRRRAIPEQAGLAATPPNRDVSQSFAATVNRLLRCGRASFSIVTPQ